MSKPELCVCGHDRDLHIVGKEPWQNGCTFVLASQGIVLTVGTPCDCLAWNPVVQV